MAKATACGLPLATASRYSFTASLCALLGFSDAAARAGARSRQISGNNTRVKVMRVRLTARCPGSGAYRSLPSEHEVSHDGQVVRARRPPSGEVRDSHARVHECVIDLDSAWRQERGPCGLPAKP